MSNLIKPSFDVFGLGHSMVDLSVRVSNEAVQGMGVVKGSQQFVSELAIQSALKKITGDVKICVGGNVRNTLQGVAALGGKTTYNSTIGSDQNGKRVKDSLKLHGIDDKTHIRDGLTPMCAVLVTPDGDRTMVTYVGDDSKVCPDDLDIEAIAQSKILYTSGYMLNDSRRAEFFKRCVEKANQVGTLIAFDLADPAVVNECGSHIRELIDKGLIDILFGNDSEMKALFGDEYFSQINKNGQKTPIIVAKQGANGAVVVTKNGKYKVGARPANIVDTTAAGDMFAAGFLYGLLQNYPVEVCAQLAAFVAADTVEHVGATLSDEIKIKADEYLATLGVKQTKNLITRHGWLSLFRKRYVPFKMKIQVAGVKSLDEARMLLSAGVDMIGFPLRLSVHKPDVTDEEAARIIKELGAPEKCLLITYLNEHAEVVSLAENLGVKNIQLHGDISVEEIKKIRTFLPGSFIIKSIIVAPTSDIESLREILNLYGEHVDAFIIDTFDPQTGASGATGKTQDWNISTKLVEASFKPVILAGGLNPNNVRAAIAAIKPQAVDVHTGVESAGGDKDCDLVSAFVSEANRGFFELESK